MHKRSFPVEFRLAPANIHPALPITGGEPFAQSDQPIEWMHTYPCLELLLQWFSKPVHPWHPCHPWFSLFMGSIGFHGSTSTHAGDDN